MIFINTAAELSGNAKMNSYEAKSVGTLVRDFKNLFASNKLIFNKDTLGVITPFRAQIACIKNTFEEMEINHDDITVDTVERYQGGARDIIIISLCTNDVFLLDSMISMNEEGIDRKLNVALTRARKQLIILGNKQILDKNDLYAKLIQKAYLIEVRNVSNVQSQ